MPETISQRSGPGLVEQVQVLGGEVLRKAKAGARRLLRMEESGPPGVEYAQQVRNNEWIADINLNGPAKKIPLEVGNVVIVGRSSHENQTGPNMQRISVTSSRGGDALRAISKNHLHIVMGHNNIPQVHGIGQVPFAANIKGNVSLHGVGDGPVNLEQGTSIFMQEKYEGGYVEVTCVMEGDKPSLIVQRIADNWVADRLKEVA